MKKAVRIALISVSALLAAFIILVTVFSLVKVNDGFDTSAPMSAAQITKEGAYNGVGSLTPNYSATVSGANNADRFGELQKNFNRMTAFSITRGILEGQWFPKARIETVVEKTDIEGISAKEGQYLITVRYGELQESELRLTKDENNPYKIEKIKGKDYFGGDKIAFAFDTVVFAVYNSNFIEEMEMYAFDSRWMETGEIGGHTEPFAAFKITTQVNMLPLFRTCIGIIPMNSAD